MPEKVHWPDSLILDHFLIVVSREDCRAWHDRIDAGESPLILGLLPPCPDAFLHHIGVQIKISRMPNVDARKSWMLLTPRWVN